MIQDIEPSRLDNHYTPKAPRAGDKVLLFDGSGRLMVRAEDGVICFPAGRDVPEGDTVYLFSVDEDLYFCAPEPAGEALPGYEFRTVRELRDLGGGKEPRTTCGGGTTTTAGADGAAGRTGCIPRNGRCSAAPAGM